MSSSSAPLNGRYTCWLCREVKVADSFLHVRVERITPAPCEHVPAEAYVVIECAQGHRIFFATLREGP